MVFNFYQDCIKLPDLFILESITYQNSAVSFTSTKKICQPAYQFDKKRLINANCNFIPPGEYVPV